MLNFLKFLIGLAAIAAVLATLYLIGLSINHLHIFPTLLPSDWFILIAIGYMSSMVIFFAGTMLIMGAHQLGEKILEGFEKE